LDIAEVTSLLTRVSVAAFGFGLVGLVVRATSYSDRRCRADLLDGRLDLVWLARCDHRTRAALGQLLGNGEADPAGRAGDQRGFAREVLGWT
jgi:hypothetical protein